MILLRIPPLPNRNDLCRDRLSREPLLANFLGDILGDLILLVAVRENDTTVLGSDIRTLAVCSSGIVHAVEEFDKLFVADDGWVEGYLERFSICKARNKSKVISLCF